MQFILPNIPISLKLSMVCALTWSITPQVSVQKPSSGVPPRFEVASIKPSSPNAVIQDARVSFQPGGRFEAANMTLKELLLSMAGFSGEVRGGPKWVESTRYTIVAKSDRDIALRERNDAVMALLEDRFKLTAHREVREVPGLGLAVRPSNPPNLQPSREDQQTAMRTDQVRHVTFQAVSMFYFANYLSQMLHTTVKDDTAIRGKFDFVLDPDKFSSPNDTFPDRIRAATESLGFFLREERVSIPVMVIDHVELPSED